MTITPHPLAHEPLAFLAFEKIRRVGVDHADGQIITHDGTEYRITSHTVGAIKAMHIVLQVTKGKAAGHKSAMAIVEIKENGYAPEFNGLSVMLPALVEGVRVPGHPHTDYEYRVLPHLPVPLAFQGDGNDNG
jgi:hypothetical protein